jgi:hypothetical protein
VTLQCGTYDRLVTDENDLDTELARGQRRALYRVLGGMISPHGINRDPHEDLRLGRDFGSITSHIGGDSARRSLLV